MLPERLRPTSFGLAVILSGLTGILLMLVGIGSILARLQLFGVGVGLMLLVYGGTIVAITWAAYRRASWAWGMLIAPALLNAITAWSFLDTTDTPQRIGAAIALVVTVATVIAGILPSTRLAMQGELIEEEH